MYFEKHQTINNYNKVYACNWRNYGRLYSLTTDCSNTSDVFLTVICLSLPLFEGEAHSECLMINEEKKSVVPL